MSSLSFYGSLIGLSLMNGDVSTRRVFLEVLVYLLYVICSLSENFLSFVNVYYPLDSYNMVIDIYRNLPYNTVTHFLAFPDTYKICGGLMFIYGAFNFLNISIKKNPTS